MATSGGLPMIRMRPPPVTTQSGDNRPTTSSSSSSSATDTRPSEIKQPSHHSKASSISAFQKPIQAIVQKIKEHERVQDEIARDGQRVHDRLQRLLIQHEEMSAHEKDVKRMIHFQFHSLHKMIVSCFDRVFVVMKELRSMDHHVNDGMNLFKRDMVVETAQLKEQMDALRQENATLKQHLSIMAEKMVAQQDNWGEFQRRYQHDQESYRRSVDSNLLNHEHQYMAALQLNTQSLRERIDLLTSTLQNTVGLQDSTMKQLQDSFKESLSQAKEVEDHRLATLEMLIKSRLVDPVASKLDIHTLHYEQSQKDLYLKVEALQREMEKTRQYASRFDDQVYQKLPTQLKQIELEFIQPSIEKHHQSELITQDLVAAVDAIKDTIKTLVEEQSKAQRDIMDRVKQMTREQIQQVRSEVDKKLRHSKQNLFLI